MFLRITFLLTLLLTSCFKKTINDDFAEKYSAEVERMRAEKSLQGSQIISRTSSVPTQSEIFQENSGYQPYVTMAKFDDVQAQNFAPTNETYDLSKTIANAGLDPDVFDLNYNLSIHPPFKRMGIEFDNIRIPASDSYGVETAIAAKTYTTPGNRILQKVVDQINQNKSQSDIKNSYALVKEKKKISRKMKMEKIFGSYEEMKSEDYKEE